MKVLKRIVFAFLGSVFTFFLGCTETEQESTLSQNQPYIFEKSVCTVYDGVTMGNLSKYIPMRLPLGQKTPETVEEFEAMVLTNIREFSIHHTSDGKMIEVHFTNVFASIEITDTVCKFQFQGEETVEFSYVKEGNTYTITEEQETIAFTYKDNRLSYTIKAPEYFEVTHYFKLAE